MSKQHGGKRSFCGKKTGSFLKEAPSRQTYLCPICKKEKRSDKLKEHYINLCHFDNNDNAISPASSTFRNISLEAQVHTKYCYDNNIKKSDTDSWKTKVKANVSPGIEGFFKKPKISDEGKEAEDDVNLTVHAPSATPPDRLHPGPSIKQVLHSESE